MSILYVAAVASAVTMMPTEPREPREARVQYEDLNLASGTGQQQLDQRIKIALNMVCGRADTQTIDEKLKIRKCKSKAMAKIKPQRELAILQSGPKIASK